MTASHSFEAPDRCVVGTVGGPGERAFYLQVRQGAAVFSMLFEKQQAQLLAMRMSELLDEVANRTKASDSEAAVAVDNAALDMPLVEEFRISRLSVAWLKTEQVIVIEAGSDSEELSTGADVDGETGMAVSIRLTLAYAREFVRRTLAVVAAGRRSCPLCEQPLHPSGHICPRANGYHRLR